MHLFPNPSYKIKQIIQNQQPKTKIIKFVRINFLQAYNQTYKEMFDQSRQKKQKVWKTLNLNLNDVQQQPQYNRSIIADNTKKYCPRKNTSHQKIFSKSKERLHLSKLQNPDDQTLHFKTQKSINAKPPSYPTHDKTHNYHNEQANTEVRRNSKYQQIPSHQQRTSIQRSFEVHQAYQTDQKPNMNRKSNQMSNFQFEQILKSSKLNAQNTHNYAHLHQQINQNASMVSQLKEQFETFKSIVLRQLEQEKEFLRQSVLRMTDELVFMRQKIREEVYAELQIREIKTNACFKHSNKNSTDSQFQEIAINKHLQQKVMEAIDSERVINLDTFGKIQQLNGQEMMFGEEMQQDLKMQENQMNTSRINEGKISRQNQENSFISSQKANQQSIDDPRNHQHHNNHPYILSSIGSQQKNNQFGTQTQISDAIVNRQLSIRQLRTYKSSGNFTQNSASNQQNNQPLNPQANTASEYLSQIKSTVSKKRIDQTDQMQRFSQILKKQYQQKTKNSLQISRLDKDKINQRINHVSKFQGAMQKLKSEIMEFKNLSDTTNIKKIKFSQQKPSQKHLKEIKLNSIVDVHTVSEQISKDF